MIWKVPGASMKTPAQIASQVVNDNTAPEEWSPVLMSEVAGLVAAGIEADRAQRPTRSFSLRKR